MEKLRNLCRAIRVMMDDKELGPGGRIFLPVKYVFVFGLFIVGLFFLGSRFWEAQTFTYIWMFCLTCWAFLHVKKSVTTWARFDEIDQRDTDFAEEVDKRFDRFKKRIEALENSSAQRSDSQPKKAAKKPTKKKAKKTAKKTKKTGRTRKNG